MELEKEQVEQDGGNQDFQGKGNSMRAGSDGISHNSIRKKTIKIQNCKTM